MPLIERALGRGSPWPRPTVLYPGEFGTAINDRGQAFLFYCRRADDFSVIHPLDQLPHIKAIVCVLEDDLTNLEEPSTVLYRGQITCLRNIRTEFGVLNMSYTHVPMDLVPAGASRVGQPGGKPAG